jgi:hypothetical protein
MRHNYKNRTAAHVMEQIVDEAWMQWSLYPPFTQQRGMPFEWQKPGMLVTRLSEEDRKLLVELTTKDIDHRVDVARQYQGVPKKLGYRSRYTKGLEELIPEEHRF